LFAALAAMGLLLYRPKARATARTVGTWNQGCPTRRSSRRLCRRSAPPETRLSFVVSGRR